MRTANWEPRLLYPGRLDLWRPSGWLVRTQPSAFSDLLTLLTLSSCVCDVSRCFAAGHQEVALSGAVQSHDCPRSPPWLHPRWARTTVVCTTRLPSTFVTSTFVTVGSLRILPIGCKVESTVYSSHRCVPQAMSLDCWAGSRHGISAIRC